MTDLLNINWVYFTTLSTIFLVVLGYLLHLLQKSRKKEALNREVMSNMAEGMYLVSLKDAMIVYTNPKFESMFGYDAGEMIGQHVSIVNAPTNKSPQDTAKEIMVVLIKDGEWHGEVENIKKDGTRFWCYANVSIFNHSQYGDVIISVHTDINEIKLAKLKIDTKEKEKQHVTALLEENKQVTKKLLNSQKLLEQAQSLARIGHWTLDCITEEVTWSKECYRIFGRNIETWKPSLNNFYQDMPEKDRYSLITANQKALKSGNSFNLDCRYFRGSNRNDLRWLKFVNKAEHSRDGLIVRMVGTVQDITEEKQASQTINKLHNFNRLILNSVGEGIYGIDLDGKTTFINPAGAAMLGWKPEELMGKVQHDVIHHHFQDGSLYPRVDCPTYTVLKGGEVQFVDNEFFWRKDGSNFPVEYTCNPIIEDGVIKGSVVTFRDITIRKKVEKNHWELSLKLEKLVEERNKDLTDNKQRYQNLVESLSDWIWEINTQGNITYSSPQAFSITGYTVDELIGVECSSIVSKESSQIISGFLDKCLPFNGLELQQIHKDGSVNYIEINGQPFFDHDGIFQGFRGIARDITARIKTQKELQKSEKMFRAIFEQAAVGVVQVESKTGNIVQANQKYCDIVGYNIKEIKQLAPQKHIHPDDYDVDKENMTLLLAGKINHFSQEKRYYHKDKSIIWVNKSVSRLWTSGEEPNFHLSIIEDITERKLMEEKLHQAMLNAQTASDTKSAFLATISHEIRTPLAGILGMSELLISKKPQDPILSYAKTIERSGKILLAIINDVLDFSKIEAGKLELESIPFSPKTILEDIQNLFYESAVKKNIKFNYVENTTLPYTLIGDPTRLQQILMNLTSNAIKFTSHGKVTIFTKWTSLGESYGEIEFHVKDEGIGIPKSKIRELFLPFEQSDNTTTRKFGGTGLGLAIVKNLVNLMKGRVDVYSRPNEGSDFQIVIPSKLSSQPLIELNSNSDFVTNVVQEQIAGAKVLLVEDNTTIQMIVSEFLKEVGLDVDHAINGLKAVEMSNKIEYDIIFMDIQMPEMDGYEATQLIRKQNIKSKKIPIIALTAHAMIEEREKCLAIGMNDHLSKPIDKNQLYFILSKWIKSKKLSITSQDTKGDAVKWDSHKLPKTTPSFNVSNILKDINGNRSLLHSILHSFYKDFSNSVNEVKNCLNSTNNENIIHIQKLLHSIKGVAGTIYAYHLYDSTDTLKKAIQKGEDKEQVQRALYDFENSMGQVLIMVSNILTTEKKKERINNKEDPFCLRSIEPVLIELNGLIASNDFNSFKCYEELKPLVQTKRDAHDCQMIGDCLDQMDFVGAKSALGKLAAAYDIHFKK
ncbi:MAG: PAS domain S-box protein [Magnetococcales bacterium]|nr:PAS domain S-box protein [Magnetococcales bacterium]